MDGKHTAIGAAAEGSVRNSKSARPNQFFHFNACLIATAAAKLIANHVDLAEWALVAKPTQTKQRRPLALANL